MKLDKDFKRLMRMARKAQKRRARSKMRQRRIERERRLAESITGMEVKMFGPVTVRKRRKTEIDLPKEPSLMELVKKDSDEAIHKRKSHTGEFGVNLLHLFNHQGVDYLRQAKTGNFQKVDWPKDATHKLVCTRWIEDYDPSEQRRQVFVPVGEQGPALSVCAIPMHRKLRASKLKIKRPLPKNSTWWPIYKTDMSLNAKKKMVLEYAKLCGVYRRTGRMLRKTPLTGEQLDELQKEFVRASRWYRYRWANSEEGKAFSAQRQAWIVEQKAKQEQEKKAAQTKRKPGLLEHFKPEERKVIGHALAEAMKANQLS